MERAGGEEEETCGGDVKGVRSSEEDLLHVSESSVSSAKTDMAYLDARFLVQYRCSSRHLSS